MEMKLHLQQQQQQRKRWVRPLLASLLLSSLLVSTSVFSSYFSSFSSISSSFASPRNNAAATSSSRRPVFVESKLRISPTTHHQIPCLAYLISGSVGDADSIKRALLALYHPNNLYVLHLDLDSPLQERLDLASSIRAHPVFSTFRNVRVVVKANLVTYKGPTMVANTLHAAAILLKEGGDWDWFINLSASDYPLLTQDDILYTLASYPRHLNFIEHTSDIGWKESQRARPVMIDPGLYRLQKSDVFWVTEKRSLPIAFKLFTGSAWMMLTRQFIEYCLWGWDNLPRTVLMYYANFVSSPEGYFHTVICNTDEFRNTTVNHDLHFISWDNPPKQHPHFLNLLDLARMVDSKAPFARKFSKEEPVLDIIDRELLGREPGGFVPGGWFEGKMLNMSNPQYKPVTSVSDLRPGPGAERLKSLISGLMSDKGFDDKHCI